MITVIDALMGQGKTQFVFKSFSLSQGKGERYLYITPLLDEVKRCQRACPALMFKDPVKRHGAKYFDLLRLVNDGENIASTHSLFREMTVELYDLLKKKGYTLVIDEALDVVESYDKLTKDDRKQLFGDEMVRVEENGLLRWNQERWPNYKGKYGEVKRLCDNGNLVLSDREILIWQFPTQFLGAFKDVVICTYMFEGQSMAFYFKANNVPYTLLTLHDGGLAPYGSVDKHAQKEALAAMIEIESDPRLNAIGIRPQPGQGHPLTSTWFKNCRVGKGDGLNGLRRLRINTEAFFKKAKTGSKENMWTVFSEHWKHVRGERYGHKTRCLIPLTTKASDEYKHKASLAYLIDRRQLPIVVNYFESRGITFRADLFSLTELIQWVWRSRIRKNPPEKIKLYVPSERMRNILVNWIRHKDSDIVAGHQLDAALQKEDDEGEQAGSGIGDPQPVGGAEGILARTLLRVSYEPESVLDVDGNSKNADGPKSGGMVNPARQPEVVQAASP